jgi:peptidoglycan-associated lipoprotein
MSTRRYGNAMIALLGLGAADLAVLNVWALPALLTVTDVSAATDRATRPAVQPRSVAPAAAAGSLALPSAPTPPTGTASRVPAAPEPSGDVASDSGASPSAVVRFRSGTWWVGPNGRRTLSSTLEQLAATNYWIEVSGHADRIGPDRINQRISQARATAVAALLVRSGVDPGRIRVLAFGEQRPSDTGRDRRVEITIRGAP